jgi:5-hydroxyisourate hydrolase
MGYLTTHVLNIAAGIPAVGVKIDLYRLDGEHVHIKSAVTNLDGRCDAHLLDQADFQTGVYELVFAAGAYFAALGAAGDAPGSQPLAEPYFVDEVVLRFGIADASLHYHVPLLVSPWSYSTYRGS